MYVKYIDRVRKAVAIVFTTCGAGVVICANLRYETGATVFGVGVAACVVAAIGLACEYLVRTWVTRPSRQLAPYQFTLAGMLGMTACVALVCSCLKVFGPVTIALLVVAVVLVACFVEAAHRSGADQARPKSPERERECGSRNDDA